MISNSH